MSIIKINIGGSGGQLGKFSPLPALGGALYAGYLFGTDYHAAAAFGGVQTDDLSGVGRSLTAAGGAVEANYMQCNSSNYMEAGFTDADLLSAGECTMIVVSAASAGVSLIEAGTFSFPDGGTRGIALASTSDSTKPATAYNFAGGPQLDLEVTPVRSDSIFEFRAATFGPSGASLCRQRSDLASAQTVSSAAARTVSGNQSVRIGQPNLGSGFGGAVKVAAAMFANKELSTSGYSMLALAVLANMLFRNFELLTFVLPVSLLFSKAVLVFTLAAVAVRLSIIHPPPN